MGESQKVSVWFHLHNVPEMTEFRMGLGATGGIGNRCDPQRAMPRVFMKTGVLANNMSMRIRYCAVVEKVSKERMK